MYGNGDMKISRRRVFARFFTLAIVGVSGSTIAGCSLLQKFRILSKPETPAQPAPVPVPVPLAEQPYTLNLRLLASSDLNPDAQSRPSPVQVRVFLMQPQADIANKGFEELFDYAGNFMEPRPMTTLTLQPDQTRDIVVPANKTQTMLVIAAAYRDPYQAFWKAIARIEPADEVSASVNIGASAVTINPSP